MWYCQIDMFLPYENDKMIIKKDLLNICSLGENLTGDRKYCCTVALCYYITSQWTSNGVFYYFAIAIHLHLFMPFFSLFGHTVKCIFCKQYCLKLIVS